MTVIKRLQYLFKILKKCISEAVLGPENLGSQQELLLRNNSIQQPQRQSQPTTTPSDEEELRNSDLHQIVLYVERD